MNITSEHIERIDKRRMGFIWRHLWHSVVVGDPCPGVRERYERMKAPRPGDLIVETSTLYGLMHRDPDLLDDRWDGQFIRYRETVREWVPYPADETNDNPPGGYWETFYVCVNPDGTEYRWFNAELCAVPDETWA